MSKSTLTQMSMVVRDALNMYSHRTLFDNRRRCENLCVCFTESTCKQVTIESWDGWRGGS